MISRSSARACLRVFHGKKVRVRFADELGRIIQAKLPGQGAVRPNKTTGRVLEVNGVGNILHQGRHQGLFLAQRLLRPLVLGDVMPDSHQPDNLSSLIAQRQLAGQQPAFLACFVEEMLLPVDDRLALNHLLVVGPELFGNVLGKKIKIALAERPRPRSGSGDFSGRPDWPSSFDRWRPWRRWHRAGCQ